MEDANERSDRIRERSSAVDGDATHPQRGEAGPSMQRLISIHTEKINSILDHLY
jgi:hypothetical protein